MIDLAPTDGFLPDLSTYSYNMSNDQLEELTGDLLTERTPVSDSRYVTYLLDANDRYSSLARTVEHAVFNGTFGNNATEMANEYGPYEEQSRFFLSIDRSESQPVGALRIIENGTQGLKSLNDFMAHHPEYPLETIESFHDMDSLDKCWDIGTVAVMPENRSSVGDVSLQLYRGMYRTAVNEGIEHFVSIIDHKAYRMLIGHLAAPFVPLVGSQPFEYLGSARSHALYGSVNEFYPKMSEKLQQTQTLLARTAMHRLVRGAQDVALQF